MSMVSARRLIGRRIVGFEPNPTPDGPRRSVVHSPVIVLDDGSRLTFVVEETDEGGDYGVLIIKTRGTNRAKE
jgi:hypothetical protein